MSMYTNLGNALHIQVENEQIEIRAWAPNSFRVRARMSGDILDQDWALLPTPPETPAPEIHMDGDGSVRRHSGGHHHGGRRDLPLRDPGYALHWQAAAHGVAGAERGCGAVHSRAA